MPYLTKALIRVRTNYFISKGNDVPERKYYGRTLQSSKNS